jgi:3-methylfumaryl-CoA hydratase
MIEETQQLLYRERTAASAPEGGSAPEGDAGASRGDTAQPDWTRTFQPDAVTLFRFSAVTDNAHRIHYDHPYATRAEGYPGLLVHAPLTALLLLQTGTDALGMARPRTYRYRAVSPLYAEREIALCGRRTGDAGADVWANDSHAVCAMRGTIDS